MKLSRVLIVVSGLFFYSLAGLGGCGASKPAQQEAGVEASSSVEALPGDFKSVMLEFAGFACVACVRSFEVTAPGNLVLKDNEGVETMKLDEAEYARVVGIVTAEAFRNAIEQKVCPKVFDGATLIELHLGDGRERRDPRAGGCLGRPNETHHPYQMLVNEMIALKRKYLNCPPFDASVSWDPATQAPPVRLLCFACGGNC